MINININGIKNSIGSINLVSLNFDLKKEKEPSLIKTKKEFDGGKHNLISNFLCFCSLPDFEVNDSAMHNLLLNSFYNVAIKLTKDFEFTNSQLDYHKKNFLAINISNKIELIEYLIIQRERKSLNDSIYYLGFRSVFRILNENMELVSYEYLAEINRTLAPFFHSFKHKELLVYGLSYRDK